MPKLITGGYRFISGWQGPVGGLTHRWPMDDAHVSGTTITDVVGTLNGTAGSGVTSVAGPITQARAIADTNQGYITLASSPVDPAAAFTIGCWLWRANGNISFDGGSSRAWAFNNAGGTVQTEGRDHGGGAITMLAGQTTTCVETTGAVTASTWTHFVATYSGSAVTLFFNAVSQAANAGTLSGVTAVNTIGARSAGVRPWGGSLYQFVIYNRVLSQAEITQLYNAK